VALARALVTRPSILLADEPTGSLDITTGDEVSSLLLEVCREQGNLTVVVTHSRELAGRMDQVLEMVPGGGLVRG
jgi:predicted ABC-type transport system involved in lysophospholipase L1 biosynthesis ATPase subunit